MKYMLTIILYLTIFFQGIAPEDPYREITMNRVRAMEIREQMQIERIDKLLATIRQIESDNRYSVRGRSGEYGAYQFQRVTWRFYCYIYEGKVLDIRIPDNQDKIARLKVTDLVEKGFTDQQIAAFWNSGRPDNWEARIGINRWGVKFDTPAYVDKFMRVYYNQI